MARREPLVAPPSVTGSEKFVKPTAMRHAGAVAVAWREEGPVPVSYTHLTLPTKIGV